MRITLRSIREAVSASSFSQLLRPGVKPSKKKAAKLAKPAEDLNPTAGFKRKHGILSTAGKAKKPADRVDSDWGFPLPPGNKRFARAVLSRAHQSTKYDKADVDRQVRKAKAIIGKGKTAESARALREYGIQADGSWEQQCDLIQKAAQAASCFGSLAGERSWNISLIASYPAKSAVIIGNTSTGELWAATYEIGANNQVTFPVVKKAKQTFALAEAMATLGRSSTRIGEAARLPGRKISESIRMHARVREVKGDGDGFQAECVMLQEGPGNPLDGHYYPGELIDRIAESGVFEGAQSYADHADDIEERARGGVRSVKDLLGWWSDVHVEEATGTKLLIGTFNVEAGNAFAQNKMREAKRYAERYKSDPSKQYVGFSIIGAGTSERQEVNGKPYNVVLDITEAGSTDMVARAGAGGRLLTISEAHMSTNLASKREEKKLLESLIDGISKKLRPGLGRATAAPITAAQLAAALKESGVELDDDSKGKMHAALANVMGGKQKPKPASDEDDEDAAGSDAALNGILEPDEGDEDDDEDVDDEKVGEETEEGEAPDFVGGEGRRKKEAAATPRERELEKQLRESQLREKARALRDAARKLVAEAAVPAAMRKDVLAFLTEQCRSEKAMRAYLGTLKPIFAENGVVGNGARSRESGARGTTQLLSVSGVEKVG